MRAGFAGHRSVLVALVVVGLATVLVVPDAQASVGGQTVAGGYGEGSAAYQLSDPWGIALDAAGNLYIADSGNHRVQRFAPGSATGFTVAGGHGAGSAANQLRRPHGIALDAAGNLYVADWGNERVQRWGPGATSGETVAGGNGPGSAANQLAGPQGLALDTMGRLYVVDNGNDRVQRWAPGATSGVTVVGNDLLFPSAIAFDGVGNMFVADTGNFRVQRFAPGDTNGVTVAGGNGPGVAANQLGGVEGIAIDGAGNLYAADSNFLSLTGKEERVQRWAPGATSGVTVAGGNGAGPAANQLSGPKGLALDADGNLYVVDSGNNRVQRFALGPPSAPGRPGAVLARSGSTAEATGPLTVSFTPPFNGGSPITSFTVTCLSTNGGLTRSATASASLVTIAGASTGKAYACAVSATNAIGTGPAGNSAQVIVGSPPAPQLIGVERRAPGALRVAFSPRGDNGSPITGFSATCTSANGGVSRTRSWANPAAASITVTGLTLGRTYTCRAQAANARGLGRPSLPSRRKTA